MNFFGLLLGSILLTILQGGSVITAPIEDQSSIEEKSNLEEEVLVEAIEKNAENIESTETNIEEDRAKTLTKREGESEIVNLANDSKAEDDTVKISHTNEYPIDRSVDVIVKNVDKPEPSSEKTGTINENITNVTPDSDEKKAGSTFEEVLIEAIEKNAEKIDSTETNIEEDRAKTLKKREGESEIVNLANDSKAEDDTVKISHTNEYPIDRSVDVIVKNADKPEPSSEKTGAINENITNVTPDIDEKKAGSTFEEVLVEAIEKNAENIESTETNIEEDRAKTLTKREGGSEIPNLANDSKAEDDTVKTSVTNEYPIDKSVDGIVKNADKPEPSSEKTGAINENIANVTPDIDEKKSGSTLHSKSDEGLNKENDKEELRPTSDATESSFRLMSGGTNSEQDSNLNNHQNIKTDDSIITEKVPSKDEDTNTATPDFLPEVMESTPSPGTEQNKILRSVEKTTNFPEGIESESDVSISQEIDDKTSENNVLLAPNIKEEKVIVKKIGTHVFEKGINERRGVHHDFEAEGRRATTFTDDDANIENKSRNFAGHDDDEITGPVRPVSYNDVRTFQTLTNQLDTRRYGGQGNFPYPRPIIENNRLMQPPTYNYPQQRSADHNFQRPHSYNNRPSKDPVLRSSENNDRHISEFNNRNTLTANAYPFEPNKPKGKNDNSRLPDVPPLPQIRPRIPPHGQNIPIPYQSMQAPARNVPMQLYNIPTAMPNYPAPPQNMAIQNVQVPAYNMPPSAPNMYYPGHIMRNRANGMQDPQTSMDMSNSFENTNVVPNNDRHIFGSSPDKNYNSPLPSPLFAKSREHYAIPSGGFQTRNLEPYIEYITLTDSPEIRYTTSFFSL